MVQSWKIAKPTLSCAHLCFNFLVDVKMQKYCGCSLCTVIGYDYPDNLNLNEVHNKNQQACQQQQEIQTLITNKLFQD